MPATDTRPQRLPATIAAMWAYNEAVRYGHSEDREWINEKHRAYLAACAVDPACAEEQAKARAA